MDVSAVFIAVVAGFLYYLTSIFYMGLSSMNRNFFLPAKYFFRREDVQMITPISKETYKWDTFVKWKNTAGHYLIYISKGNAITIPKSAISAQDVSTFEGLLADNLRVSPKIRTRPKTWTGASIGLLIISIVFVLAWLLSIYVASQVGDSILTDSPTIAVGLIMWSLPLLLVIEFGILIHKRKTDSKRRNNVIPASILLTNAAMLV